MADPLCAPRDWLPALKRGALRFGLAYVALTIVFGVWIEAYVTSVAPALKVTFDLAQDELEVRALTVENGRGKLTAKVLPDGVLGAKHGGRVVKAPFAVAPLSIGPVLGLAIAVALPQRTKLGQLLSVLFTFPWLLLISGVSLSLMITGALVLREQGGGTASFGSFLATNGFPQLASILVALASSVVVSRGLDRLERSGTPSQP